MKETGSGGGHIYTCINSQNCANSKQDFQPDEKKLFEPYVGEIPPQDTSTVVCRDYDPC